MKKTKPKIKKKFEGVPHNVFNTWNQEAPVREVSFSCPQHVVVCRSSYPKDSMKNLKGHALSVLKAISKEGK